jgi:hypothetical protein
LSSIGSASGPVRISGPLTSIITATCRPRLFETWRMRWISDAAHSPVPWAMLSRKTSTPALMSCPSLSKLSVEGPSVAMIFVCR